jgi:hypothetical protein
LALCVAPIQTDGRLDLFPAGAESREQIGDAAERNEDTRRARAPPSPVWPKFCPARPPTATCRESRTRRAAPRIGVQKLAAFVVLYALAALFHHFVRHDNVLNAMLPGRRR